MGGTNWTIREVHPQEHLLKEVISLWRSESDILGFMPRGGFQQAAQRGCLLAAVDSADRVGAYLFFRTTEAKSATIVHLCVAPDFRSQGLARHLFDALRTRCAGYYDLRLSCRRDFDVSKLWPRLGFVPAGERAAKRKGERLTIWRYDLETLPLLRLAEKNRQVRALRVVIDANVFLDLDEGRENQEESSALRADWLSDLVELHLTDEILTEIDRASSAEERERQRARAALFPRLQRQAVLEEQVFPQVRSLLPAAHRPSTTSDARQIAMTVAAGVTFFVTRDTDIQGASEQLYEMFGLRVVSPLELILHFDELRREEEYRPKRTFMGPGIRRIQPRAGDIERLVALLHAGRGPIEGRRETVARLRDLLAAPGSVDATCLEWNGELLAAFIARLLSEAVLDVPFFAVADSTLGRTAARHCAEHFVATAVRLGRTIVRVADGGDRVEPALSEAGFSREEGGWVKVALPLIGDASTVAASVARLGPQHADAASLAGRIAARLRETSAAPGEASSGPELVEVERALWPAKITGTGLPCFVVPIQPRWAKDLFDQELARGTLFGADPNLALNSENVYYRAAKPSGMAAPARVFWYVSQDVQYPGSMALRACSYVDQIVVAPPKEVFRRFKRIGIYEWDDVFQLAKRNLSRDVMAFRFTKTELMRDPITWDAMQRVLARHGKASQVQSPLAISEACFLELYAAGMGRSVDAM